MRTKAALALLAAFAVPAAAHDLCKDHSRPCRWKDAAKALCYLDDSVRELESAGAPAGDPNLTEIKGLIAHTEGDLRENRERLQGVAADAERARAAAEDD